MKLSPVSPSDWFHRLPRVPIQGWSISEQSGTRLATLASGPGLHARANQKRASSMTLSIVAANQDCHKKPSRSAWTIPGWLTRQLANTPAWYLCLDLCQDPAEGLQVLFDISQNSDNPCFSPGRTCFRWSEMVTLLTLGGQLPRSHQKPCFKSTLEKTHRAVLYRGFRVSNTQIKHLKNRKSSFHDVSPLINIS